VRRQDELVELFSKRVADYGAAVHTSSTDSLEDVVAAIADAAGASRLAAPPELVLTVKGVDLVRDDEPRLAPAALELLDGALTGAAFAIAETGTVILDGGPSSGRRIISLIPDLHICLVEAATIVPNLPDAIARLIAERRHTNPLTFVSGPSATVDIGFERVQGVHGPRRLHVVIVQ
jgi:L-lactate dehydrogenase complex protein LldG